MICVSREELGSYLQGKLDDFRSESVEQHLRECEPCEQLAGSIDRSGDSLLKHLKISPTTLSADSLANRDWSQCLETLRQIPNRTNSLESESSATATSVGDETAPAEQATVYHYVLESEIGRGGMGVVYRSVHPQLQRPVAVKVLSASRAADAMAISRFQKEMRTAGALDHPSIVRALDAGVWQDTYFLVMELIEGVDLSSLLSLCGPLGVEDACLIGSQAAAALQYAHEQKVIHRDVKPSNLMLTSDASVKILDFGLARLEHSGLLHGQTTTTGRLVGTLDYIAPEQAIGSPDVGPAADVYSLGATMYRLLTGQPPHGASRSRPILQQLKCLTEEVPQPITELRADLPKKLGDLVMQMLAHDPQQRPSSAGQVAERLQAFTGKSELKTLSDQAMQFHAKKLASEARDKETTSGSMPLTFPAVDETKSASLDAHRGSANRNRVGWLGGLALLICGGLIGMAAVTLWLKSGPAMIQIESEVDDISLQLVQDGKVAKEIQVHPGTESSEVRVGRYEILIKEKIDNVRLDQDRLLLMRGDRRIVRITKTDSKTAAKTDNSSVPDAEPSASPESEVASKADPKASIALESESTDKPTVSLPTSRGRTYEEWTDIILRERDPETVIDGIGSLQELDTPETHAKTFETLMKVADWNDSRKEAGDVCDSYIGWLTTREKHGRGPRGGRGGYFTPSEPQSVTIWKDIYPEPQQSWRTVANELTLAIADLPDETLQPAISKRIENGSEASKCILLAAAQMRLIPRKRNGGQIIRRLDDASQPPSVRGLAIHLRMERFDETVKSTDREALTSTDRALAKAVLASLLRKDLVPYPEEQGIAAARLSNENGLPRYLLELAKAAMKKQHSTPASGDARKMLQSMASQMVEEMGKLNLLDPTNSDLQDLQPLEMLACGEFLDDDARTTASKRLHEALEVQLTKRNKREAAKGWVGTWFVIQTLVAVDGEIPEELERHRISPDTEVGEAFAEWKQDVGSSRSDQFAWMYEFPLETVEVLIEKAATELNASKSKPGRASQFGMRSRVGVTSPNIMSLTNPPFGTWAINYALRNLEKPECQTVLPLLFETHPAQENEELRLALRLAPFAESLLSQSKKTSNGRLLQIAHVAGADDARVQKMAFEQAIAKIDSDMSSSNKETRPKPGEESREKPGEEWAVNPESFATLLECIASVDKSIVTVDQAKALNERFLNTKFPRPALARKTMQVAAKAAKALFTINHRVGVESDPDFRVLLAALGETKVIRFPPCSQWYIRSDEEAMLWRSVAGRTGAVDVFRVAVEAVVEQPVPSPEVLTCLQAAAQKTGFGGRSASQNNAKTTLSKAISAVSDAIQQREGPSRTSKTVEE